MIQYASLKPWRVCRFERRLTNLAEANTYAAQHASRFVHVLPESKGEATAWAIVAHCERESTAREELARLQSGAPPGVSYAVLREGSGT